MIALPDHPKYNCCRKSQTVAGKNIQGVLPEVTHKESDCQVAHQPSGCEADGENRPICGHPRGTQMSWLKKRRPGYGRRGQEEGEPCSRLPFVPLEKPRGDRDPRSRYSGNKGQGLGASDDQRLLKISGFQGLSWPRPPFSINH